ncbi:MAG TPA: argininosuccinate lyase, partial [Verrucomicrobiales bacterium]|nr:argininosuccinate lyase [Verrucomicrobiales bacterium]
CNAAAEDPALLATDLADWLVEQGAAFREAHHLVGAVVALSETLERPLDKLKISELKKIDKRFTRQALEVFSTERAMERRQMVGSPGIKEVKRQLTFWKKRLKR